MSNPPERRVTLGSAPQEWLADHSFKFADYSFFDSSAERCHHRQGPGGHRREAARACAGHGYDDWRRGLTCRLGLADSGAPAWLSATRAAKFASSIALTVCSAPSSSRPMTSWFPIAPAAPAGTLE